MFLIRIIPIARGIGKEELTYFSKNTLTSGTLVSVPLRKREVLGLVLESMPVKDAKTELRTAGFQLRKLKAINGVQVLSGACLRAAMRTADFHATTTGAVLYHIVPKSIFESGLIHKRTDVHNEKQHGARYDVRALQAPRTDRYKEYKNTTRETFARGASVMLVVPTVEEAERLYAELSKGIEQFTFLLTGRLTKKSLIERWSAALREPHAVLMVMTPGFVTIPRHDIGTIVIEREQSSLYRMIGRSPIDVRMFLKYLAHELSIRLICADLPLSIDTAYHLRAGNYALHLATPSRISFESRTALIDMRTTKGVAINAFRMFSPELTDTARVVLSQGGRVFLFAARRGLSPMTICQDCGTVVACKSCGATVVLHKASQENNFFVCHSCSTTRSARERCTHCASWRLVALGIGIERVHEEVTNLFSGTPVFRIDRDAVHTPTQARETVRQFLMTPGSILVGTEMALSYLDSTADFTAVVSIDSLLAMPAWNIYEKIFSLLIRLREHTSALLLVQTRHAHVSALEQGLNLNLTDFFAEELRDRQEFLYPPFSVIIKVTAEGTRDEILKRMTEAQEHLGAFGFVAIPHMAKTSRGTYIRHGFLKVVAIEWPKHDLMERLRELSPSLSVEINPDTIL